MKEVEAEKDENNTRYNRTLVLIDFAMKKKNTLPILWLILCVACYSEAQLLHF